jgi:hypothetical protein
MGQDVRLIDGIQNPDVRWSSVRGRLTRVYNGEPAFLLDGEACPNLLTGFLGAYSFKEMAGMPGVFVKKADKSTGYSDSQDALAYACSRLFVTNEAVRGSELQRDYFVDDEDDMYYSGNDQRTGRSSLGGY